MHGDDDGDKTVFGQKLPSPKPAAKRQPQGQQPGGAGDDDAEKTVFGTALPPQNPAAPPPNPAPYNPPPPPQAPPQQPPHQPPPAYGQQPPYAPAQQPGSGRAAPVNQPPPDHEDTWLGGALNPFPDQQPPPTPQPAPPQQPAYGQNPIYQPQHVAGADGMFPEVPRNEQPEQPMVVPRISLEDALRGTGLGAGGSTNPLVAAAANLLILLGRLRTGLVEMQSGPLIDHVTREIDLYERNVLQAGVAQQDAADAKYALAATADDIVQNLPGADRGTWLQYSMVARFFGERESGVGFFQKMDAAMQAPGQRFNLLELMLTCLSLGFEGQYRTSPNGAVNLARVRSAIYETLRRVQPRPDDDISVSWLGVPLGEKKNFGGSPVWAVAAVGGLMVLALFATLSTIIARQGAQVQQEILALHAGLPAIAIERKAPVIEAYVPEITVGQLERIRTALAGPILNGLVVVDQSNQFIFVRVGDALQFRSGRAELESEFDSLARSIAAALDPEPGPIRVDGYTDSIPLSGRGRYKTNAALSLARAQAVAEIMTPYLSDAARVETQGLGPVNPIASNDTAEGRALNRRVEIMIQREGTL